MSPLAPIAHLAAIAVGVWAGFALMGVIGTPKGTGAEARAEQEAAVERGIEEAAAAREQEEAAQKQERVHQCRAQTKAATGELPRRVRRGLLRACREGSIFSARSLCVRVVAEVVDPVDVQAWSQANAACRDLPQ